MLVKCIDPRITNVKNHVSLVNTDSSDTNKSFVILLVHTHVTYDLFALQSVTCDSLNPITGFARSI